jgi:hypothetical protein
MFPKKFNPDPLSSREVRLQELWDLFRAKFDCMKYNGKVLDAGLWGYPLAMSK